MFPLGRYGRYRRRYRRRQLCFDDARFERIDKCLACIGRKHKCKYGRFDRHDVLVGILRLLLDVNLTRKRGKHVHK